MVGPHLPGWQQCLHDRDAGLRAVRWVARACSVISEKSSLLLQNEQLRNRKYKSQRMFKICHPIDEIVIFFSFSPLTYKDFQKFKYLAYVLKFTSFVCSLGVI